MKDETSSLDLYFILPELKIFENSRIDKIFQMDKEFLIIAHVSGKGKNLLKISLPSLVYLTEFKEQFPTTPPGFCMFLRKRLAGAVIRSIEQIDFERILEFKIETKEDTYYLMVELFQNGNVILCDSERKIISAFDSHRWKDRTVRGGIPYELPPRQTNTPKITFEEFSDIISKSELNMGVKSLAVGLGFGGLYARELCALAKIDDSKEKFTKTDLKKLFSSLQDLIKKGSSLNPIVCKSEIFPFKLESTNCESEETKSFETFSTAIDSVFSKKILSSHTDAQLSTRNSALDKIKRIVNQQKRTIKGLEVSAKENQEKGEAIYHRYQELDAILKELNLIRKKHTWEEIKEKLKGHKTIKLIDDKNGTITVDI